MTLTEFLLARIAEDEAWITGWGGEYLDECQECAFGQQPDSPYSRARVLVECEAKRRLILMLDGMLKHEIGWDGIEEAVMVHLALPYADHPDYQQEWRS